jgi:hypothetical protein
MKTISAKIPDSDNRMLEKLAKATPGGKSALVRDAVHEYCSRKSKQKQQLDEAIDSVFGIFKDAPLDARKHREELSKKVLQK